MDRDLAGLLLAQRIGYYSSLMKETMLRYWIGTMLVGGYLMTLLDWSVLAMPVLQMAAADRLMPAPLIVLLVYDIFAIHWIHVQRESVAGGEYARYIRTLPVRRVLTRTADLVVLLLANNLLILPFLAAPIVYAHQGADPSQLAMVGFKLSFMFATLLTEQLFWLRRQYLAGLIVLTAKLILLGAVAGAANWIVITILSTGLFTILFSPSLASSSNLFRRSVRRLAWPTLPETGNKRLVERLPLALQWRILFRAQGTTTASRILSIGAVSALVLMIVILGNMQERTVAFMYSVFGISALIASGCFRQLLKVHQAAGEYLRTLPLGRWYLPAGDLAAVLLLHLALILPLAIIMMMLKPVGLLDTLLGIGASLGLLTVLQWIQVRTERQAVLVSSIVTVAWIVWMVGG